VVTFFTLSVHYILLNAQFLAVVNFIVYMGAIMVLFLFVLMLLNLNEDTEPMKSNMVKIMGVMAGMCLFSPPLGAFRVTDPSNELVTGHTGIGLVKHLGSVLFTAFRLPSESSAILLLIAMFAAVLLAKKEVKEINKA